MYWKRIAAVVASAALALTLTGCGGSNAAKPGKNGTPAKTEQSAVDKVITQAQGMTLEELAKKAIEESNGKMFYGLGNSSRGKTAFPLFVNYLKSIDPNYDVKFEWQQPKNNKIFEQLQADSLKQTGTFAMTLIQDGNQIKSKMTDTGILKRFLPKEWVEANKTTPEKYRGFLPLQTLNKVFMYNSTGSKTFTNVWDFVQKGVHPLYMDIDSELVGKNFLYMLTKEENAKVLKDAFDKLDSADKSEFEPVVKSLESDAKDLGLGKSGAYALAWIKLWVNGYNEQTDDGPICNTLVSASATDKSGLLVYSKLRSIEESPEVSKNNIKVAAYQDGFQGFGGFGYQHYLFLTNNSPLPWTAAAFISYMSTTADGFSAWGKDIGGYSMNPKVAADTEEKFHHSKGGYDEAGNNVFDALNDRGYDWWVKKGKLVLEDPNYCSKVSFTVGSWVDMLDKAGAGEGK